MGRHQSGMQLLSGVMLRVADEVVIEESVMEGSSLKKIKVLDITGKAFKWRGKQRKGLWWRLVAGLRELYNRGRYQSGGRERPRGGCKGCLLGRGGEVRSCTPG